MRTAGRVRIRRRGRRRLSAVGLLAALALLLPEAVDTRADLSLVKVESAKAVDFDDGRLWLLALGSDARSGTDLMKGRADAIQLLGLDFGSGSAVALGIPRDFWVDIAGRREDRINAGLAVGGPELMARLVEDLVGIKPDYVLVTGFAGFSRMVDAVGGVTVTAAFPFEDPEQGLSVRRGPNRMDGGKATAFSRSRYPLPRGDFDRSANHQALLTAILQRVRNEEDGEGFIESGALAALRGLHTDLSATDLYRLAHALTELELSRVDTCVLAGTAASEGGASVVHPDRVGARRAGADARRDVDLDRDCPS